jgi:fructose-1,6-bisphosphatase/sedoheptulose 1,7-bisphosphatase-like protein
VVLTLTRESLTTLLASELERVQREQRKLEADRADYTAMREKVARVHFASAIKLGECDGG